MLVGCLNVLVYVGKHDSQHIIGAEKNDASTTY